MSDKTTQLNGYEPGSFGCHEALHMASVLGEIVDERLRNHPAVQLNHEWRAKASEAVQALFDLYNMIGGKHL